MIFQINTMGIDKDLIYRKIQL